MVNQRAVEQPGRAPSGDALERRSVIAWLAVADICGPILFTATFVVQGLFRLGEYSPVAEPTSALEAGRLD